MFFLLSLPSPPFGENMPELGICKLVRTNGGADREVTPDMVLERKLSSCNESDVGLNPASGFLAVIPTATT